MRAQWEQVAADLGLNFRPGLDGVLDSPRIQEMFARSVVGGDSRKASEVLTNPLLRSLLAKVFTGFITGVRDGFEVFLIPDFSDSSSSRSVEPHDLESGDLNGDGIGDLVALCQDKLLIYLGE